MSLSCQRNNSFALKNRLRRAQIMYSADFTRVSGSNNPQPCCTTGDRRAVINVSQQVAYGTRLTDITLGQLECCRAACNCSGQQP